jgi:GNAT superfamily N-acetyltransferase
MAPIDGDIGFLTEDEIGTASALVDAAGWNQNAQDWRLFLAHGTVYAVRDSGRLVATAATLPHEGRFAWISMVLVAKAFQRRGLATRLMRRSIDDLLTEGMVPILDATPAGREVYRHLGFGDAWTFERLVAVHAPVFPAGPRSRHRIEPIGPENREELLAYDAGAFGADRSAVLNSFLERRPEAAWLVRIAGRVAGFVLARDGLRRNHVGPLVADDTDIAATLLRQALAHMRAPLQIDASRLQPEFSGALKRMGFVAERPFTRMLLGREQGFEDTSRIFAVAGPEFG